MMNSGKDVMFEVAVTMKMLPSRLKIQAKSNSWGVAMMETGRRKGWHVAVGVSRLVIAGAGRRWRKDSTRLRTRDSFSSAL